MHCDEGDITEIRSEQILESAGARRGEVDVVIGGPPCQSFSTAGMRRGLEDKRGMALLEFIRVVKDVRPKFFVFENVSGLVSAARKHVPFYDRMSAGRKLSEDQKCGSLFADILSEFEKIDGYRFRWKLLNAADYGVPQKRKRLILIGSRIADPGLVLKEIEGRAKYADPKQAAKLKKKPWRTLRDALEGIGRRGQGMHQIPKVGEVLGIRPAGGLLGGSPGFHEKPGDGTRGRHRRSQAQGQAGRAQGLLQEAELGLAGSHVGDVPHADGDVHMPPRRDAAADRQGVRQDPGIPGRLEPRGLDSPEVQDDRGGCPGRSGQDHSQNNCRFCAK